MIIRLSQAGREGLTLRLTRTRGRKIAFGRDGFFGRRNVSRLRSLPKWFSARDERTGARTARGCRTPSKGARCARRPPSPCSSSPTAVSGRIGRALLCVCSDTRINCVYVQFAREPAKSKSDQARAERQPASSGVVYCQRWSRPPRGSCCCTC